MKDLLANWSEAQLLYFINSPRVNPNSEADDFMEADISLHFDNVKSEFGATKAELATAARKAGVALHLSRSGKDSSAKAVEAFIKKADEESAQIATARKAPRRAGDVKSAMVSRSDIKPFTPPPVSKSALKPGLFILYGGAEAAKSHRLSKLFQFIDNTFKGSFTYEMVHFCEPVHSSMGSWDKALASMRYGFIDGDDNYVPDVMLVDSLKDLFYMPSDGGSMGGGMSAEMTMVLSALSAQLMSEGRTVIAVVNPSQPKFLADMYETLVSNVTGVFFYSPTLAYVGDRNSTHFKPSTVVPSVQSYRVWTEDHYERVTTKGLMSLVGLDGDILDIKEPKKTKSVADVSPEMQAKFASNMRDKLRLANWSQTPRNGT